MNASPMPVAVLYNAVDPHAARPAEQLSEQALETAARQAAEALTAAGFAPRMVVLRENIAPLVDDLRRAPAAVVNLCEGFRGASGYEADVAGLLELMDLPFTGNASETLALCRDKFRTKAILSACGLTVPAGFLAEAAPDLPQAPAFPLIVKPNSEDAGIGIYAQSIVRDPSALLARIKEVGAVYAQPALVEEFIEGREINVAVIQEEDDWRVLPFSEICFQNFAADMPKIVGYEAKWQTDHPACRGTVPVCPASVSAALAGQLETVARHVCRILRLRGYARLDFRVSKDETAFLLEVNPNPDTSRDAGLARSLQAAGISYENFWRGQVELALRAKR